MKSCCLVLLASLCFSSGAAAQPPPVEAFAALPTTQSPAISPDGKRIAFIAQTPQGLVYAAQLATNTADAIVAVRGELDARAVTWANNDTAAMTLRERSMGVEDPRSQREKLVAASPARHVERVHAAVLLIHGRDDAVVPFGQSRTMQRALLDAGKTVQLVELDSEDHWPRRALASKQ